jgi:hypothetical protein
LFEYYYENIYKIEEVEIAGGAKQKIETYEYLILKDLAKEIEHKVGDSEKKAMIDKVMLLKENMNSFSTLINEYDLRRTLNTSELLNQNQKKNIDVNDIANNVNLVKLRNLKTAFDEGLITEEEYNNSKRKFLGAN